MSRLSAARAYVLVPLLTVLVLGVTAVVTGAVFGGRAGQSAAAESQAVRNKANDLYSSFSGSTEQRNAGLILKAYAYNGEMDACMDRAGYPAWDWSDTRQYATPTIDPLADGVWFAEPQRRWRSQQLMAQQPRLIVEKKLNSTAPTRDERDSILRCAKSTPPAREDAAERSSMPSLAWTLSEDWSLMVENFSQRTAPPVDEYFDCVDAAKVPVLTEQELTAQDAALALSAVSPDDDDIPADANDPRVSGEPWKKLLSAEQQLGDADWQCRAGEYDAHIAELAPELERFAAVHRTEIEQAQRQWEEIDRQARELGFDGQPGPLGK